ncbi:hypothetical protein J7K55_05985 [Candidatus Aerophobetes bacterium]|nr:hypothetical protein [Candidatus Aerophobetes bacterium]
MLNNFWSNPLFWISIYLVGYITAIVVLGLREVSVKVENKTPKPLVRIFALLTFGVSIIALPFTEGPRIAIPTSVTLAAGAIILGINFIIKILTQRQIGASPALKSKAKLVTTGIYGIVRNPLYMSNGLLAVDMAILFKSMYALLFPIPFLIFLSYILKKGIC